MCMRLQPPQRPKLGQSGSTRSGEVVRRSSPLPNAAVFVTFTMRTRQVSPGRARGTNTARPFIRHTPAPSEVKSVMAASYISFFFKSSMCAL